MTVSNPMGSANVREKLSATLKQMGHKPPVQGGNGRPLPVPQQTLLEALGEGWSAEFMIRTGQPKGSGYPPVYKADLAQPSKMAVIEVDGLSHGTRVARARDAKRTELLRGLGWRVFRVRNERISTGLESVLTDVGAWLSTT